MDEKEPVSLSFHEEKKGQGVTLSNDQKTAERTGGFCVQSAVLSSHPMEINCLYQVSIDKTDTWYSNAFMYLGVVTQDLDEISFPRWPGHVKQSVVIYHEWVMVNGKKKRHPVGSALSEVVQGCTVGLRLDNSRALYLYKDGQCLGEVHRNLPQTCYFMVDLGYCCKKVTALPVRRMA